jgi:putative membrane protein
MRTMKPVLSENDRSQLEKRIAEAEKLTKTQIVLATAKRSDSYTEIPWKAFALGASITGLLVFSLDLIQVNWINDSAVLISIVTILAASAFFVLLTILLPGFARLFLSESRAETETRQYAESLFLSRELFSTARRKGILLLISQFERKVVILPDKGLCNHVSKDDLKSIIALMKRPLAQNEFRRAMEIALDEVIRIVEPLSSDEQMNDELSNEIIEDKDL